MTTIVRRRRSTLLVVLLAGCATAPPLPAPDHAHPACPEAEEAPERAPSQTLTMPERTPAPPARAARGH